MLSPPTATPSPPDQRSTRRAALLVLAATWPALAAALTDAASPLPLWAMPAMAATATALQLLAGLAWSSHHTSARTAATLAALLGATTCTLGSLTSPARVLATWLAALLWVGWLLWRPPIQVRSTSLQPSLQPHPALAPEVREVRALVAAMAGLWWVQALGGWRGDALTSGCLASGLAIGVVIGIPSVRALVGNRPLRAVSIAGAWLAGSLTALQFRDQPAVVGSALLLGPLVTGAWSAAASPAATDEPSLLDDLLQEPVRLMLGTFVVGGVLGGLLLATPMAATGAAIAPIDAFFTAFSAICVTGLGVRDTGADFSTFGQLVILVLIQLGGLGILTFSTGALLLMRDRLSLRHESAMTTLLGAEHRGAAVVALKRMLQLTFTVEAVAAVLLFALFVRAGDAPGAAAWNAVFSAISAFCNAGFALRGDSLMRFAGDPLVLWVFMATIVVGGLGPVVVTALPTLGRRRQPPLVPLVLWTTALLIVVPALLITVLEWDHALAALDPIDRIHNAFFQSVTTRTAGFNSVPLDHLQPATWSLFIILMFIGGSPGSTAGGVKTTTLAVLVATTLAAMRGRDEAEVFGFRLSHATVYRAGAVVAAGLASAAAVLFLLQLTQALPIEQLAFETVSALATVGLTIGATGALDDVGKIVVIVAMFAGRVGPLSLILLVTRGPSQDNWRRPVIDVAVG